MLARFFCFLLATALGYGHAEPTSYVDGTVEPTRLTLRITASAADLAQGLPQADTAALLDPSKLSAHTVALSELISACLQLKSGETRLPLLLEKVEPDAAKQDVRLFFSTPPLADATSLQLVCQLFPYDPRHQTFYHFATENGESHQGVLTASQTQATIAITAPQSIASVMKDFTWQGLHHIFIGPDHVLFIISLLLLGGTLGQLLRVVTAFTLAHSITLSAAVLGWVQPSASVVEPIIALSIVFTGINALLQKKMPDLRLPFAFLFGLIHGFGFAFVLQELSLPPAAQGWALFSFNVGVELGQCCIVLVIAPLLHGLLTWRPLLGRQLVTAAALVVIGMGAFWFCERILPEPPEPILAKA